MRIDSLPRYVSSTDALGSRGDPTTTSWRESLAIRIDDERAARRWHGTRDASRNSQSLADSSTSIVADSVTGTTKITHPDTGRQCVTTSLLTSEIS